MKFENLSDLKTSIPSIIATFVALLSTFGVFDPAIGETLSETLTGLCFGVLTLIGLFSKSE